MDEEKKLSTKEYVRQRLSELHAEEPLEETTEPQEAQEERKGPGRPRKYPVGYKKPYESQMDPTNPVSVARSKAGKAGIESRQKKEQGEYWRRRKGHEAQELLDQFVATLNQELATYTYAENTLDKADCREFADICLTILGDCIWQRQPATTSDDFYDEIELDIEDKKFCRGWIDRYMHEILVMASYTLAPDRPLLQKLAIQTAEQYLLWSKTSKNPDVQVAATETKALLGQLQNGKIYKGLILPDHRLDRPEPGKSAAEQSADREQWSKLGRGNVLIRTTPEDEQFRLQAELETAILEQKAEQQRQALEQQQRALLGSQYDDIQQYLRGSDGIFGSTPSRR